MSERIYHMSEAIWLGVHGIWICPECIDHIQEEDRLEKYIDCKNVFVDDKGQSVGQCCCWSVEHGLRDKK